MLDFCWLQELEAEDALVVEPLAERCCCAELACDCAELVCDCACCCLELAWDWACCCGLSVLSQPLPEFCDQLPSESFL